MTRPAGLITLALLMLAAGTGTGEPIQVCAVGDINMGTAFPSEEYLPPDGGAGLFPPVSHFFDGDVVFGNLEGPLADSGETKKCKSPRGCFAFRTPTAYVKHLKEAGFNVLSIANNHAMDFGEAGRKSTIDTLDKAGIAHSGPVGDVATITARGKKVAFLAFTTAEHSYNLLDIDQAAAAVAEADKNHDLVLVSFHGGSEGKAALHTPDQMEFLGKEPRGHLVQFTHALVDAGADLILGHGPHLLRGMEVYKQRLIVYSLGNFCTYARFNLSGNLGLAVVLKVELDPQTGEFLGGKMHSTYQVKPGGPKPDPEQRGARASDRQELKKLLDILSRNGHSDSQLRKLFGDRRAGLLPVVLERFARPAEKLPYAKYRAIFIKDEVLEAGKKFLEEKKELLTRVEEKFQVDRESLCGIIATETRFGIHPGKYSTFNALSTVVLKYPRRSRWARKELRALMSVFSDDPLAVTGSYAGAVGLVQFMPTSIQSYGVDWDKDGKIDLDKWSDALASAANYLKKHGWKRGKPIRRGTANYRAIFRYNPAHNYVKVVKELAESFGYLKEKAKKKAKKEKKKEKKKKKN
jgi:membrane-bound lytic murein transglycosylase B